MICFEFIKLTIPDFSFFATQFAALLKVFVVAIPILVGIPVHFKTVYLILLPYSSKSSSLIEDKSKNASSIE